MQLPQIRMTSQMAQISIRQTMEKQVIQQPEADLSIKQPHADLSIQTKPSKLQMDQTKAWEDMNLMSARRSIEVFAAEGWNGAMEGAARRAVQGKELMKIENDGNPIVSQAIENASDGIKDLGITFIPSRFAVDISFEPAESVINAQSNAPIMEAKVNKPVHHYQRGAVEVGMQQYQRLDIDVVHLFSASI